MSVPAAAAGPRLGRRVGTTPLVVSGGVIAALVGLAAGINPLYGLVLVLVLVFCVTAALRPSSILGLLIVSLFLEIISFGGVSISRLVAPIAIVVVLVEFIRGRARMGVELPLVAAAAYTTWAVASGLWTVSGAGTTYLLSSLAIALVYMVAFAALLNTRRQLERSIYILGFAALLIGASSILAFGGYPSLFAVKEGRASGGVGDPSYFANVQLVALPLVIVVAAATRSVWIRWMLYISVLVIIGSVLTSLSRGGLIALLLVVALVPLLPARTLFASPRAKAIMLLVIAVGTIALSTRAAVREGIVHRFASVVSPSGGDAGSQRGSGRDNIWAAARLSIGERPLLGLGYGAFVHSSNELMLRTPGVDLTFYKLREHGAEAHNAYLGTTAELGFPGLALFVLLLLSLLITNRRTAARARESGHLFVARFANALILSLVGWGISSIFITTETSRPLWIMIGLTLALPKLAEEPLETAEPRPAFR